MSIFKTKEWQLIKVGQNEEFDRHLIEIMYNNSLNDNVVIVASFEGLIRAYSVCKDDTRSEPLFELNLEQQIVQVKKIDERSVGVLLNRELLVCQFSGQNEEQVLKIMNRIKLQRNSYNMISYSKQQKYIIVQSTDCQLQVIENNQIVKIVQLNEVLPVLIENHNEDIVIYNQSFELMLLKYDKLFTNQDLLFFNWKLVLNNQGNKIQIFNKDIMILLDSYVYRVNMQTGSIIWNKKLEYQSLDLHCYQYKDDSVFYCVLSQEQFVYIYQNKVILWAARLDYSFICLQVHGFSSQQGLLLGLTDGGVIQVSFLGSEQIENHVQTTKTVKQDFNKVQQENGQLAQLIREKEAQKKVSVQNQGQQQMKFSYSINKVYESSQYLEDKDKVFSIQDGKPVCMELRINLSYGAEKATDVKIYLELPNNIYSEQNPVHVDSIQGNGTPYSQNLKLYLLKSKYPYSREFKVNIVYNNYQEEQVVQETRHLEGEVVLDYWFQLFPTETNKDQKYKVTIQTDKELPKVQELYEAVIKQWPQYSQHLNEENNVYSFMLNNGVVSSVMLAKVKTKFRVQSNEFEGVYYLLKETVGILKEKYGMAIIYNDSLPFPKYFQIIDDHNMMKEQYSKMFEQLEKKTYQFRIIQKRLIQKFKDTSNKGLMNLDELFKQTYKQVIIISKEMQEYQEMYQNCADNLVLANQFIIFLIRIRFNLNSQQVELLEHLILSDNVYNLQGISWQDSLYNNIQYFLKLQKQQVDVEQLEFQKTEMPKLKKIITLLFDKISKGLDVSL